MLNWGWQVRADDCGWILGVCNRFAATISVEGKFRQAVWWVIQGQGLQFNSSGQPPPSLIYGLINTPVSALRVHGLEIAI